jgi:hypothetical protein
VLFQVGLAGVLLRKGLDIAVYLLDGAPRKTVIFVAAAKPTTAAFMSVLEPTRQEPEHVPSPDRPDLDRDRLESRLVFGLKVLALSVFLSLAMLVSCVVGGFFVYVALDPLLAADDLAGLGFFFVPFTIFGVPSLIASARLALLQRRPWLVAALLGATFVLGTLSFAGWMVAAMGI